MMKKLISTIFCAISLQLMAQNQNLSNGVVFDGEPYIMVNPNNSQHLVVAWMGWKLNNIIVIKTRTSFDAGATWSTANFIPHTVSGYQSADPSLAFDNNGNLFLCFIDYKPSPAAGGVYVVKSTDGGLTWGTPTEVINVNADGTQYPIDRPWMVIDNSNGTYDGNIYVTTMNPNAFGPVNPPYNPYFIRSTNNGVSFEPWKYLDAANWLAGNLIPQPMPTPSVASNGNFYAIYPSYVPTQNLFAQFILASSTNGGTTFSYNAVATSSSGVNDTLAKKGYLLKTDPANAAHLAFFYVDDTYNELDIFMIESTNSGLNWTSPIKINDDVIANNKMQDLVWAGFDTDGDLLVTWRDRRNAPDSTYTTSSEIWTTVRKKDSTNFSPNFTLSDSSVSYNSILASNGNDFMSCQMINDTVYAVWGDTRNGYLNIWFSRKDLTSGNVSITNLANNIKPINSYPNPAKDKLTINFGDNDLKNATLQLLNSLGEIIYTKKISNINTKINLQNYPNGNYFIKFNNANGSKVLKVVKE